MNKLLIDEYQLTGDIQSLVAESITNVSFVGITATEITAAIEANLNLIVQAILGRFGAGDLLTTVTLALKELATNAAKANLKNFLNNQWAMDKNTAPKNPMEEFRRILGSQGMSTYAPALKAAGLSVQVGLSFDDTKLTLTVTNSIALPASEKQRLKDKLALAQKNPDLRKLHAQNNSDAEGAGLGMVMVMNALRSSGIDPLALTYNLEDPNQTIAEIVFPFSRAKPIDSKKEFSTGKN